MAHLPADSRALLVRSLRKLQHHGRLTGRDVRWAARALQVSERTVWRWLTTQPADPAPASRPGPRPYLLTEADRDALADWCGSAAAAWRAQQAAGVPLPALRTFQRAVRRQLAPAERAALADGAEGRRRHAVYLRWEASHRNQVWEADHKHLPVLVLAPKAQRPRTPWVTLFLDAYSRLVMGWAISLYPSSATALTALRMGLVIDPERGPFGGVPTLLRWDNGLEFAATALTRTAAALGCVVSPTPPYTPHLKGKIERLHRTITQEFLNGLPFYTNGPRAADQTLYGPAADPITLDRFAGDFDTWVRRYNTTRPHRGLGGQTPLERWCTDPTPIEQVPADQLRGLLLADQERTIGKDGIHFRGLVYVAAELNGRVGQRVTVLYMPHDPRQIELKLDDGWVTAKPQGLLTAAERDQVLARRRADAAELARRQRRASRRARLRLAPITGPGPIQEPPSCLAGRRQTTTFAPPTTSCNGWPGLTCSTWRPAGSTSRKNKSRPVRAAIPPSRRGTAAAHHRATGANGAEGEAIAMPAHFLNLKGAKTVATQQLLLTRQAITDLVELSAMGVVHGLAGTGKSFAVDAVLERERAIRPCLATFENYPTIRLVASTLVTAVLGADHQVRTRFQATPALVEALSNGPRLLVIDEAQQLNSNCIEYLRYLHDHQRTNFALLLVGGDGCWEVLSREPMLRSRVHRRVAFRPMTSQEVPDVLARWHRLYYDQDPELLGLIDDVFGHGLFRNWVHFTKSFLQVFPRARLDKDKARAIFALFGGTGAQ